MSNSLKALAGVIALLVVVGGAYYFTHVHGALQAPQTTANAPSQPFGARGTSTFQHFGTPSTLADIATGDRVLVNGTANADGSVAASMVLDGVLPDGAFPGREASSTAGAPQARGSTSTGAPRSFADLQNMTDAQRQAFIAQRQAEGGGSFAGRTGGASGTSGGTRARTFSRGGTTVHGTVASIDGSSIIVNVEGQGTRLVMTSSSTAFRKVAASADQGTSTQTTVQQ
jgi:hypothetical protein